VHIFLRPLAGPGLPAAGNIARLDRLVLIAAVALHRGAHDRGINDLAAHVHEPLIPENPVKAIKKASTTPACVQCSL
ncbi:MAG: hypothetical protein QF919_17390, partial [Nitrospinota bacterium]|nr:hypothetical protein [Nitrospinota bacterium]